MNEVILEIVKEFYDPGDPSEDSIVTSLYVNDLPVYIKEDYYHNKIDEKIKGFIKCLDTLSIKYSMNTRNLTGI